MTRAETDCTLQQKDNIDYPVITVTVGSISPKQQRADAVCLAIAQLLQTSKQMTSSGTNCALLQVDSVDCAIIADVVSNGVPRLQHTGALRLSTVKLAQTNKHE